MDLLIAAPFLRGLALAGTVSGAGKASRTAAGSRIGKTPRQVFVTALPLPELIPVDAALVDVPETGDELELQKALKSAAQGEPPGGASGATIAGTTREGPKDRCFALRHAGMGVLLTVKSSELPGHPPGDLSPGSALDRHLVVSGKAVLVTGGAQGFGEEIVRGLVSSGATVFIADLNRTGAERLAAELNAGKAMTVAFPLVMDVSSEESVALAFDSIARTTGGLDLVVSNAGVLKAGSVLEQSLPDFEFVTKVNYTAFFLVAKHAGLMMRRQHSGNPHGTTDIIQINSKSGLEGSNKNGAYAGSKFGGIGLVQSFALELVEHGIKVNAICPGNFFDGPLWSDPDRGLFVQYLRTGKVPGARTVADVKAFYEAKVPMRRGCEGPDVMRAIFYLIEQRYETGQALPVTGGQVMLN